MSFWQNRLREAPDRLDAVIRRVEEESRKEIASILEDARETSASASRNFEIALRRAKADASGPTERLLAEQQDTRAWQRAQRLLDAGVHPAELIARAGETGDTATLRVLRAELPVWLEASAVSTAEPLHHRSATLNAERTSAGLLEQIDRAEARHLPREQREALEALYQVRATDEIVQAKTFLAMDVANGNHHTGRWIHAAFAEEEAKRGLLGSEPEGDLRSRELRAAAEDLRGDLAPEQAVAL